MRTVQKDLDIQEYSDPEHDPMIRLREVWNAGGFSPFHGWNNRAGAQAAAGGRKVER